MWAVLRHGQTQYHSQGRYQGRSDESSLTESGRKQTLELAGCISKQQFSDCYVSPVKRARESLELLRSVMKGTNIAFEPALSEVSIRSWEGRLKEEIGISEPYLLKLWRSKPHLFSDANGNKPLLETYGQIGAFLGKFSNDNTARLLIGHDHVNRAVIATLLDLPIACHHAIPQALSSMSIVHNRRDIGRFTLHVSNLEHVSGRAAPLTWIAGPRLILIRHGVTTANISRVYQGSDDFPLNQTGELQVDLLTEILDNIRPSLIVSSCLERARGTALRLPFPASVPRVFDNRLNEYDYGRWQGCTDIEVERLFPEDIAAWRIMNVDRPIPDGERASVLVGRVSAILNELWCESRKVGTIIVVSHDVVIRTIIALSLQLGLRHIWAFPIANAGLSELRLNDSGSPVLSKHNILPGNLENRYGIESL